MLLTTDPHCRVPNQLLLDNFPGSYGRLNQRLYLRFKVPDQLMTVCKPGADFGMDVNRVIDVSGGVRGGGESTAGGGVGGSSFFR